MSDRGSYCQLKTQARLSRRLLGIRFLENIRGGALKSMSVLFAVVLNLAACSAIYDPVQVRFRLSGEVQDGAILYRGSTVIQNTYILMPDSVARMGGPDTVPHVSGYALSIDMGNKGLLFITFDEALRTSKERVERSKIDRSCYLTDITCLPFVDYGVKGKATGGFYSHERSMLKELLKQRGPREVPLIALPDVKWLVNKNIEQQLIRVVPANLSNIDGKGLRLSQVMLEITSDAVTPIPTSWPGWLQSSQYTWLRG